MKPRAKGRGPFTRLAPVEGHEFSLFSRARLPKDGGDEPCVDRRDCGGRPRYHLPRAQVVQSARVPSRPRPRQRHPAGRLPAPSQSGLPGRPRDVSRMGARPRRQDVSRPETAGMPGVGRSGGWGTAEGQHGARVHRCEHPRRARPSSNRNDQSFNPKKAESNTELTSSPPTDHHRQATRRTPTCTRATPYPRARAFARSWASRGCWE